MICKQCKKEIPDESVFCNWCGKKQIHTSRKKTKTRGNGQGSVYQLSNGKWRAVVTLGYVDGKRKTKAKTFAKKADAVMYLPELAKDFTIVPDITFKECYDKMMIHHEKEISENTRRCYVTSIQRLKSIHHMKMRDIKLEHLQKCFDDMNVKNSTKRSTKGLVSLVYDYAIKNDIVVKDYSSFIVVGKNDSKERKAFSNEDILKIKAQADKGNIYCIYAMCLIFTGFRVGELFSLKKADYYDGCLHGGSKTDAGKNRVVPVAPIIQPYIDKQMKGVSDYLFPSITGRKMNLINFSNIYFREGLKACGIEDDYVPHCCRHTFATLCNRTNSNDFAARKRLIGHTDLKTTERYTHTDIEDMRNIINQLSIN